MTVAVSLGASFLVVHGGHEDPFPRGSLAVAGRGPGVDGYGLDQFVCVFVEAGPDGEEAFVVAVGAREDEGRDGFPYPRAMCGSGVEARDVADDSQALHAEELVCEDGDRFY